MNILFVAGLYLQKRNSAAVRNNALVEGLRNLGHNVYIETFLPPSFNRSSKFIKSLNNQNLNENEDEKKENNFFRIIYNQIVKLRYCFLPLFKLLSRFFFPDFSLVYWFTKPIHPDIKGKQIDLIISSSDCKSSHFIARKYKRLFNTAKWVQIWGDPWINDISFDWLHLIPASYYEKHLLKQADCVFYISQFTCEIIKAKYSEIKNKINFLPRSFYQTVLKKETNIELKKEVNLIYPGSITKQRNLSLFAECLDNFNKNSKIKYHLHIFNTNNSFSEHYYDKYESVSMNKSLEYFELLEVFKSMDAFIFLENPGDSGQIPGKLFDYFGTNLPIVCLMRNRNGKLWNFLDKKEDCYCLEYEKDMIIQNLEELLSFCLKSYSPDLYYSPTNVAKLLIESVNE